MIRFWWANARPTALPQSVLPALLAMCLALSAHDYNWWLALIGLLGVVTGHLGLNLFDDYFDYRKNKTDYRDTMTHEGFRARIGKCTYLTSGAASIKQLLHACIIYCCIALFCGAIILYFRGEFILYITLITIFLGLSYSGAPLRLSYHGLGELTIGFIFGPLNMLGIYYAASGHIDNLIILISIPIGLLVMNIVYVHSILDFEPDKKINKLTLAVLLNNQKSMLIILFFILFLPYLIISYGVIYHDLSNLYLLTFITLPIAIALFVLMLYFVKEPDKKFKPKFWMGPMNQWKRITELGIDWFMLRWLLARNLLTFFCVIIIVVTFLV